MPAAEQGFLAGGGEMGALIRARTWTNSPLGPPETWPQSLRSVVGLMLGSKIPMFVAWGPELGFLYNDAYVEILGKKHPAALGARFHDIWQEIWPAISPLIETALSGEATYHEDLPLIMNRRGFDEQTWFTFSYSPVRDEHGAVAGMFCACQETTARVMADRRKKAETEQQRRMFEQAPGFICTLRGPDHVFDFVNAAHRQLFGDRHAVGKTMNEAFPDLAGQGYNELLDKVYQTGERHVARAARATLKTGPDAAEEVRYVDFMYAPIFDEGGQVTGIFCEGYDVTEVHLEQLARARAEKALRERERELQLLADALPALVSYMDIVDGDVRYRFVNRIYEEWFPRRREEIIGKRVRDVVGETAFSGVKPWIDRAMAGERVSFEQFMPYSEGRSRHISADYVPRIGSNGEVEGIYALVQDVTEARALAEKMQVLLAELQHRTRNLLGVVRSVARRTIAGSGSLADFKERFDARLEALARVNGLLAQLDKGERIPFDELVLAELSAHGAVDGSGRGPQVTLEGPSGVRLRSATVQTIALAIHELATNAIKHGALSHPRGKLRIHWSVVDEDGGERRLRVEWEETGGTLREAAPDENGGRGFGRELIERALPFQLKAETTYEIRSEGVYCAVALPI
jgi:PAS domain S-box-containing protein